MHVPWVRVACWTAAVLAVARAPEALAHGGEAGDHLAIGYYYGHDSTFEAPASPPMPPTILVDTHPWELPGVMYDLAPAAGLLTGWTSGVPGFATLDIADEEFGGHGFFSYLNPGYSHGTPDFKLHLDSIDAGLTILDPTFLIPQTFPLTLGSQDAGQPADFHAHMLYRVAPALNPPEGTVFTATFHVSDANGYLANSEPFTVQFQIVPEPATAILLMCGATIGLRRFRQTRLDRVSVFGANRP